MSIKHTEEREFSMAIRDKIIVLLFSVVSFLIIAGCSSDDGPAPKNNVPAYIEQQAQRLITDLTAQGYEVTRGYFKL